VYRAQVMYGSLGPGLGAWARHRCRGLCRGGAWRVTLVGTAMLGTTLGSPPDVAAITPAPRVTLLPALSNLAHQVGQYPTFVCTAVLGATVGAPPDSTASALAVRVTTKPSPRTLSIPAYRPAQYQALFLAARWRTPFEQPRPPVAGGRDPTDLMAIASPDPATGKLRPSALRGPAHELRQYPTPSLATARERAAAMVLLGEVRESALKWENPADAAAAGYAIATRPRRPGDRAAHWLHAERPPGPPRFDPDRPKAIIYANAPGRPLVLIGIMFSMPRGVQGPNPGGAITRWHTHSVCVRNGERGKSPRPDGSCPPGSRPRQGSEMMHIWLTRDLRSAFAIHAPVRELCIAALLPKANCDRAEHAH
jgi:hypothetical protein